MFVNWQEDKRKIQVFGVLYLMNLLVYYCNEDRLARKTMQCNYMYDIFSLRNEASHEDTK
jgi:hypothetical protein